ncbi:MAG TPA: phospholipid carrier-dependent glycosyltransferase [Tepidisphaeraceae bacterium]|nr:phospholipid carrier-dependent glycosyltransferase [Tepidisphaeraceae bacterium]
MSYSAALQKSPTIDESVHVVGGYLIRWADDYRIDDDNPPLFGFLTTILQRQNDLGIKRDDPWLREIVKNRFEQWAYSIQILYRTLEPASDQAGERVVYDGWAYVNRARAVFTFIGLLLGALLAWWSYKLAGAKAALIATLLFAFDPNFLAHSSIVKNDVPMALAMLWLMYSIWSFGRRANWLSLTHICLACALAVGVKFSGPLAGVFLVAALSVRALMSWTWQVLTYPLTGRMHRLLIAVSVCIFTGLFCWGGIWAAYGFRYSMTPDPTLHSDRTIAVKAIGYRKAVMTQNPSNQKENNSVAPLPPSSFVRIILWIDDHHLLPEAWTNGLLYTRFSTLLRTTYLMGKVSDIGPWYYFPCAMLFKTPLATLLLAAILLGRGAWRTARSRQSLDNSWNSRWTMICLWLPIAIYGFSAMQSNLAIGVRHVLPLYPFFYILMATALARWIEKRGRAVVVLTSILLIGLTCESVLAWPDYISFFNIACGGARGGIGLLGDSNLDWGQDLPLLSQWQQKHPDVPLYLMYFGTADPTFFGIDYINVDGGYDYSPLPIRRMDRPGILAVSASILQGISVSNELQIKIHRLRRRQPLTVLGGSIYLYEWTAADAADEQDHPPSTSQP